MCEFMKTYPIKPSQQYKYGKVATLSNLYPRKKYKENGSEMGKDSSIKSKCFFEIFPLNSSWTVLGNVANHILQLLEPKKKEKW